jgi:hypothetical protein
MLGDIDDVLADEFQSIGQNGLAIRIHDVFPVGIVHPLKMRVSGVVFDVVINGEVVFITVSIQVEESIIGIRKVGPIMEKQGRSRQ